VAKAVNGANHLSDFPAPDFTIRLFCDACDHRADLDREKVPESMTVQQLPQHLRCTECGGRECSVGSIYSAAGGFNHS